MRQSFKGAIKAFSQLPGLLSQLEKSALGGLLIIVAITGMLWWQSATSQWIIKPVAGGVYTEGIIDQDPKNLDLIIARLTRFGLTYVDHQGQIQGGLATHWEISSDGKIYTFFVRDGVNAQQVAESYRTLPQWENILVEAPDKNRVVITLKQPFAPMLAAVSEPVIEAGPYKKEGQTKNELSFMANPDFALGEPYIQKLILFFYPDERSLKAALQRQEVMGADQAIDGVPGTLIKKIRLTKQTALIFNLEKPLFKDAAIRQKIRDGQPLDQSLALTLVTNQEPELLAKANKFSEQVKRLGLTISIKSLNPIVIERDIVPNDNYDLFLADLHYGYDEDPYPYWHSSQIIPPGNNYAGYNSKEGDRLIEEARKTQDPVLRQQLYDQFRAILVKDIPAIFYPIPEYQFTVAGRLKGIPDGVGAVSADRFSQVWEWFIKYKREPAG